MDSQEDATACYELQMPKIRRTLPPYCDLTREIEPLPPKMTLQQIQ